MRVSLVPDVPDQSVARSVENIVQGDRQLDHPEPRPEMPPGHGYRADRLGPQFVGELPDILFLEAAQIRRTLYGVEQRRGYDHDRNYIVASSLVANSRWRPPRDPNLCSDRLATCITKAHYDVDCSLVAPAAFVEGLE